MQIIIRGQNVKSELIAKSLALTRKDTYTPSFLVSYHRLPSSAEQLYHNFILVLFLNSVHPDINSPQLLEQKKSVPITFGYNTRSKEQYGAMMYHKNRLIKAYEHVGCQLRVSFHAGTGL